MSETRTVRLSGGKSVDMPLSQIMAIARLGNDYPGATWHFAECGCCVCFHPVNSPGGWLIGSDGGSTYFPAHD